MIKNVHIPTPTLANVHACPTNEMLAALPTFLDQLDHHGELDTVHLLHALTEGRQTRAGYHANAGTGVLRAILQEKAAYPDRSDKELRCCVAYAHGRVLDYGGGAGDLALCLALEGFDVSYAEINPICVAFARYLFQKAELPLQDSIAGQYDTIFALNVLDHLDDPILELDRLCSLLVPGGLFVASFSFDAVSNPVHVGGTELIWAVEDLLKTRFEELHETDILDDHRLFRKRVAALPTPRNSDGSAVLPPTSGGFSAGTRVALSDEIEITRAGGAWRAVHQKLSGEAWEVSETLVRLLLRLERPMQLSEINAWFETTLGCSGFDGGLERTIRELWKKRIIKGWIE